MSRRHHRAGRLIPPGQHRHRTAEVPWDGADPDGPPIVTNRDHRVRAHLSPGPTRHRGLRISLTSREKTRSPANPRAGYRTSSKTVVPAPCRDQCPLPGALLPGEYPGAGAAVRQQYERCERTLRRDGHAPPLADLDRDHLDRHRVLARPGRWPERPQLHRVLRLQPVLFPAALIVAYLVYDRTHVPPTTAPMSRLGPRPTASGRQPDLR
jgi:hypothetical protein